MDVRCTRCGTEYEFDDALISERGTSVRCTQCAYQFKVFPYESAQLGPDEWVVLTSLGRRVVYRTLRELQNGIAKGEVAREDLLARGSKPPRPLGSIAELDPLFVVKAAPERQPSTLTGVAPPPARDNAKVVPPPGGSLGRQGHDTFSGVAPPANSPAGGPTDPQEQAVARPGPPLRVGGKSTALGMGATAEGTAAEGTAGDGRGLAVAPLRLPDREGPSASTPPETRSFESLKPEGDNPVTSRSEPPTNRPPTIAPANAVAAIAPEVTAPLVLTPEIGPPQPTPSLLVQPEPLSTKPGTTKSSDSQVAISAKVEAKAEVVAVSDPPTARWTGQSLEQRHQASPQLDRSAEPESQATKSSEEPIVVPSKVPASTSLPATAPGAVPAAQVQAPEVPAAQLQTPKSQAEERQRAKPRADTATSPPSTVAKASSSAGRIALTVGLLALGLFAGMKIVGTQLHKSPPLQPEPAAALRPAQATWNTPIDELLELGDEAGAEQLLSSVPATEQDQPSYRVLRVRALAMSADMVWWKIQLIGKNTGDAYTQSKRQLSERLERLERDFTAVGPGADWPEQVGAAWLDARRMQGEKSEPNEPVLLERLKHPTTTELKYTQLVLVWVRAGLPDGAIVEGLRQVRAARLDLGPHAVALVVALVQLNRFDDAREQLKSLANQPRPHPLYDEMVNYVRAAEQAQVKMASNAGRDAGTLTENAESGELDPDLTEGDFRLRLTRASECLARNELTKAQKLLRSVLAQRPNDTEAITAMGDLQRRRGDLSQARSLYDKALALNANYLPALSGAADARWKSGDRSGAAYLYRSILDRVGETSSYGQVAAARLKELEGTPKPAGETMAPTSVEARAPKDLP